MKFAYEKQQIQKTVFFKKEESDACRAKYLQAGIQGLHNLIQEAFAAYKSEVVTAGTVYEVYVMEFLDFHRYTDRKDAAGLNEHRHNYDFIDYLLHKRKDLLELFLDEKSLTETQAAELVHLFRTTTSTCNGNPGNVSGTHDCSLESYFSDDQIDLITQCVNEAHLFVEVVDAETMLSLFDGKLPKPLTSSNNRRIAFFFDKLCESRLISGRWQCLLEKAGAILSLKDGRPLKGTDFSSALNRSKSNPVNAQQLIIGFVRQVKEMSISDKTDN